MEHALDRVILDPYYPLVAGYEWIYAEEQTGNSLVYLISDLRQTPEGSLVTFSTGGEEDEFLIRDRGLYRQGAHAPILKFPLRADTKWRYLDEDLGMVTATVRGPEEIETPAGLLRDCFRVEHEADRWTFLVEWYGWEVGLAKWIERYDSGERSFALSALICL